MEMYMCKYVGGHPAFTKPINGLIKIDLEKKMLYYGNFPDYNDIVLERKNIIDISIDEKSTMSAGKAATGAIIGGALTSGIGFLAGAAFGGRKRNDSTIYVRIIYHDKEFDLLFKAGKKTDKVFAALNGILV